MIVCEDSVSYGHGAEGETRMLPGVIEWLRSVRWIRQDSLLVRELPLNGRRVDLAIMTNSGRLSSFELKIGGFNRVLEQASYNQLSFDRSWIVVSGLPRFENIQVAKSFGIGIIAFTKGSPQLILRPGLARPDFAFRAQLHANMVRIGGTNV